MDHQLLKWLHSVKDPTSRLIRWRLKLTEYEDEVVYKAGQINANADALSRTQQRFSLLRFWRKPMSHPIVNPCVRDF